MFCRNWRRRKTNGRKSGWSLSGNGENGKRSGSGRGNAATGNERRSERGNGSANGNERKNGRGTGTKTENAGPESESGNETGPGAATEALNAAAPGKGHTWSTGLMDDYLSECVPLVHSHTD